MISPPSKIACRQKMSAAVMLSVVVAAGQQRPGYYDDTLLIYHFLRFRYYRRHADTATLPPAPRRSPRSSSRAMTPTDFSVAARGAMALLFATR